jgi:Tol biopolymer transport system component
LWFRDISTGDSTSITLPDSFTSLQDIEWSPSGNQIAFLTRDDQSTSAIWTIDKTGEAPQRIIQETQESILSIRWSKTGDGIYFLRSHGDVSELVRMDVSPSIGEPPPSQEVVLSGLIANDFDLLDGNGRILYRRFEFFGNLWLVELNSSGEAEVDRLTSGTAGKWNPSVSPDGERIAFMMRTGSVSNIYVLPLKGGAMKRITYRQSATCPVWSPDGSEIAFISEEEGRARVWKVTADGGIPEAYPSTDVSGAGSCLAWAPGDKILYQRVGNRHLHQLDAETGEEHPLVSNMKVGRMFDPVYSPDGTKVAVKWLHRPDVGMWVISLRDDKQERIANGWNPASPIGWSPDGEWVYGYKVNQDSLQISRYSIVDHSAVVVSAVPQCGRNVLQVVMTPDASRFVCVKGELRGDLWIADNVNLTGRVP